MKKYLAVFFMAILLTSVAGVWAQKVVNTPAVTLRWIVHYTSTGEKELADWAISEVKKVFPNVTIAPEILPQDNDEKVKTMAATGDLPDLIDGNEGVFEILNNSGQLVDLGPAIKSTGIAAKWLPSANPFLKDKNGRTYAICGTMKDTGLMYINKKIFADNKVKVPTNYGEFLAAVKAFKAKGILPMALFAKETWTTYLIMDMLVTAEQPLGLINLERGGSITEKAYVNAANKFVELVKAGLLSKDAFTTNYEAAYAIFSSGKSAMFANGSWQIKDAAKDMGDNMDLLYPCVFGAKAGGNNAVGGGFGNGIGVSTSSPNKDIAAQVCCYLAEKWSEGRIIKSSYLNTMLAGTYEPMTPYGTQQKKLAVDMKKFSAGTVFYWGHKNAKIQNTLGENIAKLVSGQIDASQYISESDSAIKEALAEQ